MRKTNEEISSEYKFAILDDEAGIIDSVSVVLRRKGYNLDGFTSPLEAIERIRTNHYDLLILDYLMEPIHGDEVVERIRKFNKDMYILLLTGHKDIAPPLETIKSLDIQGYCEKSDKFDQLILLIESGLKSISQMRTIKKYKDGLNNILKAVPEIYHLKPVGNILEDVLSGVMAFLNGKNAFILADDTNNSIDVENKIIYRGIGKYKGDISKFIEMFDPSLMEKVGHARMSKKTIQIEGGIIFPLVNELSKTIGVMFIDCDDSEDSIKLLEIYAKQAASSISNAFLHSLVNIKNEELNKAYDDLRNRYMDTIEVLRLAVDAKDVYTRGHSDRVAYYAAKIGQAFELPANELEILRLGGVFHDIGKIGTADDILLKTESLNKHEYDLVKQHTNKGAYMLSAVSMFKGVVPLVKYHHERIDGKGYPEGLKGEDIPFLARVLSVADAFDAMTSDRLYRSKLDLDEAKRQLTSAAGTQFDSKVVEKFVELLKDFDQMKKEVNHTFN